VTADPIGIVGSFRFDDPEGRVDGDLLVSAVTHCSRPATYRVRPLAARDALITTAEHSVLGAA